MGQESERDDLTETRTTARAEAARRDENERLQAEHPERVAGRGRESGDPEPREASGSGTTAEPGDRLRARRNEDTSEG